MGNRITKSRVPSKVVGDRFTEVNPRWEYSICPALLADHFQSAHFKAISPDNETSDWQNKEPREATLPYPPFATSAVLVGYLNEALDKGYRILARNTDTGHQLLFESGQPSTDSNSPITYAQN